MPIAPDAAAVSTPDLGKPKRHKLSREAQRRVSAKIAWLVKHEGKTAKQAAGEAYAEEEAGRLGPRGGYKPKR